MAWGLVARGLLSVFGKASSRGLGTILRNPFKVATAGFVADQALNNGKGTNLLATEALGAVTGIDLDDMDIGKYIGMGVTFLAITMLGKNMLGDGFLGTIASVAMGAYVALKFDEEIEEVVDKIADYILDAPRNDQARPSVPAP